VKKPDLPEVVELDDMTSANVRGAYVVRFGPKCAAWLCKEFKHIVKKYGAFALHRGPEDEVPPWLQIALDYLRDYARKWTVLKKTEPDGHVRYRVIWLCHRPYRWLPDSIRRIGKA
jgi:hypothetical protein